MSGNLTAIKITQLNNIGANISATSLIPIVDTSNLSNPITDKANLQIVGNLILNGAGGIYFPPVAQAFLSQTVTNAAQPNITSVGVLNNLSVTDVSVLNIPGGSNGYYLRTNGNGNVSWAAAGSGGNGTPGGLNTQVQYNNAGAFAGSSGLTFNSTSNTLTVGNISASNNVSATTLSGILATTAQPNITSVGNLTTLTVTGNVRGGNLSISGSATSNVVTANYFSGDGSNISNVTANLSVTDGTNTKTNINSIRFNGATITSTGAGQATVTNTNSAYVLITTLTATGTENRLTFSNIPQIYKDLIFVTKLGATVDQLVSIFLNNDTSSIYNNYRMYGGSGSGGEQVLNNSGFPPYFLAASVDASLFTTGEITFPYYSDNDNYKQFHAHTVIFGGTFPSAATVIDSGMYQSTSTISDISFRLASGGTYVANSKIRMYGRI